MARGNIVVVGKYIGTEKEGIFVNGVYFKKGVLTDACVTTAIYNELLKGVDDGWFCLLEPVTRTEVKQLIANIVKSNYMTNEEVINMMNEVIE